MKSGTMYGLWFENRKLKFRDNLPVPVPLDDEAIIQVQMAGICSTDLELIKGYYPFSGIPGHEFVGVVASCSKDPTWIGKRVVGEINIACGECEMCKSGLTRHCERRKTLGIHDWNGAFAEYLVLPISNLHEVPDIISNDMAVFTEPTAAANEILEQISLTPKNSVLIIGAGRLGQLAAQVVQGTGCDLEVLVRHPKQEKLLTSRNIRTLYEQSLENKKYDVIIEATGSPDGFKLAKKYIVPRGRIVLKSTFKGNMNVNFSEIVVDEVTVIGSRCGPFEPALWLLKENKVDPRPLIEAVYPLEQGELAFAQAAKPGMLKVLLQIDNITA